MLTVAELVAHLRADAKQFRAEVGAATGSVEGLEAATVSAGRRGTAALLGIGAAAAIGIGKATKTTIDAAAEVKTLERQLGVTAESASRLRAVGEQLGISQDKLSIGFRIFSKHLVDGGSAFEKYGIHLDDAHGRQRDFNSILDETADRYRAIPPGIARTAFVMDLFGRSGQQLIPMLSLGSRGIKEFENEASVLGVTMSQKDVDAARQLSIEGRRLGEAFQGLEISIGTGMIPILEGLATTATAVEIAIQRIPGPIKDTLLVGATALAVVRLLQIGYGFLARQVKAAVAILPRYAAAEAESTVAAEAAASAEDSLVATRSAAAAAMSEEIAQYEALVATMIEAGAASNTLEANEAGLSAIVAEETAQYDAFLLSIAGVTTAQAAQANSTAGLVGGYGALGTTIAVVEGEEATLAATSTTTAGALEAVGGSAAGLLGPFGLAVAAIGAVVGGFLLLQKDTPKVSDVVSEFTDGLDSIPASATLSSNTIAELAKNNEALAGTLRLVSRQAGAFGLDVGHGIDRSMAAIPGMISNRANALSKMLGGNFASTGLQLDQYQKGVQVIAHFRGQAVDLGAELRKAGVDVDVFGQQVADLSKSTPALHANQSQIKGLLELSTALAAKRSQIAQGAKDNLTAYQAENAAELALASTYHTSLSRVQQGLAQTGETALGLAAAGTSTQDSWAKTVGLFSTRVPNALDKTRKKAEDLAREALSTKANWLLFNAAFVTSDSTIRSFLAQTGQSYQDFRAQAKSALDGSRKDQVSFVDDVIGQYRSMRENIAQSFDGIGAALSEFGSAPKQTERELRRSFDNQAAIMRQYEADWATLRRRAGGNADDLLRSLASMGLDGSDAVHVLAGSTSRDFRAIVRDSKLMKGGSNDLATTIQRTLVPPLRDLVSTLREMFGLPPLHVSADTSAAQDEINRLRENGQREVQIPATLVVGGILIPPGQLPFLADKARRFADGGRVRGGVGGGDSVPAMLTPGELVTPVPVLRRGPEAAAAFAVAHMADGGLAGEANRRRHFGSSSAAALHLDLLVAALRNRFTSGTGGATNSDPTGQVKSISKPNVTKAARDFEASVMAAFSNSYVVRDYTPGAVIAAGSGAGQPSQHAFGNAVDLSMHGAGFSWDSPISTGLTAALKNGPWKWAIDNVARIAAEHVIFNGTAWSYPGPVHPWSEGTTPTLHHDNHVHTDFRPPYGPNGPTGPIVPTAPFGTNSTSPKTRRSTTSTFDASTVLERANAVHDWFAKYAESFGFLRHGRGGAVGERFRFGEVLGGYEAMLDYAMAASPSHANASDVARSFGLSGVPGGGKRRLDSLGELVKKYLARRKKSPEALLASDLGYFKTIIANPTVEGRDLARDSIDALRVLSETTHIAGLGALVASVRKLAAKTGSLPHMKPPKEPGGLHGGGTTNPPAGGVAGWLAAAMAQRGITLGSPAGGDWLSGLRIIADHESGDDPHAKNTHRLTPRGYAARGLLQMIPGTFNAYSHTGRKVPVSKGFSDPGGPAAWRWIYDAIENPYSGIGYIKDAYGTIDKVPGVASVRAGHGYHPYRYGGLVTEPVAGVGLRSGDRYSFGESGVERVTPIGEDPVGGRSEVLAPRGGRGGGVLQVRVVGEVPIRITNPETMTGRMLDLALEEVREEIAFDGGRH